MKFTGAGSSENSLWRNARLAVKYINNGGWRTSDETSLRPDVPTHIFRRLAADASSFVLSDRSAGNNMVPEQAARQVARPEAPIRSATMPHYTNIARLPDRAAVGVLDLFRCGQGGGGFPSTPPTTLTTTRPMFISVDVPIKDVTNSRGVRRERVHDDSFATTSVRSGCSVGVMGCVHGNSVIRRPAPASRRLLSRLKGIAFDSPRIDSHVPCFADPRRRTQKDHPIPSCHSDGSLCRSYPSAVRLDRRISPNRGRI